MNAIDTSASLGNVDAHLDMLRPAISNYGGSVQVPPPPPPGGDFFSAYGDHHTLLTF